MNSFMNNLTNEFNYAYTQNGALSHKSTRSAVYDMFATGAAYRNRNDEDCILLFKNALEENMDLALKCLFYICDIRGGQGERRFFRVCFRWLADNYPATAIDLLSYIPEYRRWDDLINSTLGTKVAMNMLTIVRNQLSLDIESKTPSLLAKWLPSINASSYETKRAANVIRRFLGISNKEYRKMLSELRKRINVLEKLMSANEWEKIEFDKIPSKAGIIYKNAFARRDLIAKKYEAFAKDETTKVNAQVLYPYDVVNQVVKNMYRTYDWHTHKYNSVINMTDTDRLMTEKYWNNLPDYLNGADCKMMCVVDTSGSMTGSRADAPINVAISLSMYCAERLGGDFKNHYISFSSRPQLIKIEGVDFADKVKRIYDTNLVEDTNLIATFELLRKMCLKARPEDRPNTIVVISDMQINAGARMSTNQVLTEMETERLVWERDGLVMPKLIYWNVNASGAGILDDGPNVSYVSGCSPVIFEQVLIGKTGYDLMLDKLMNKRYENIRG